MAPFRWGLVRECVSLFAHVTLFLLFKGHIAKEGYIAKGGCMVDIFS